MKEETIVGNYRVEKTIGSGTFGKVKQGTHLVTHEKVAIKVLDKDKINQMEDIERVRREIKFLKTLNGQNVIQLLEIVEDSISIYLVMEYAGGGELFNHIVKKRRLNEYEASFFYFQLIEGLESIHSKNIVHRDLKPENLLFNEHKQLKIIDFGLSNSYTESSSLLSTPCGSPCYAAPEMVLGNKYSGVKTDIWSTGIILFAMTAGYLPFEDQNNEKLFKKIVKCDLEFPNYITQNSINMIKLVLNTNPDTRVTLNDIKQHDFYLQGKNLYQKHMKNRYEEMYGNFNNSFTETLGDKVSNKLYYFSLRKQCEQLVRKFAIEKMVKELKFNADDVSYNIENNKHNNITATFFLLVAKYLRDIYLLEVLFEKEEKKKPKTNTSHAYMPINSIDIMRKGSTISENTEKKLNYKNLKSTIINTTSKHILDDAAIANSKDNETMNKNTKETIKIVDTITLQNKVNSNNGVDNTNKNNILHLSSIRTNNNNNTIDGDKIIISTRKQSNANKTYTSQQTALTNRSNNLITDEERANNVQNIINNSNNNNNSNRIANSKQTTKTNVNNSTNNSINNKFIYNKNMISLTNKNTIERDDNLEVENEDNQMYHKQPSINKHKEYSNLNLNTNKIKQKVSGGINLSTKAKNPSIKEIDYNPIMTLPQNASNNINSKNSLSPRGKYLETIGDKETYVVINTISTSNNKYTKNSGISGLLKDNRKGINISIVNNYNTNIEKPKFNNNINKNNNDKTDSEIESTIIKRDSNTSQKLSIKNNIIINKTNNYNINDTQIQNITAASPVKPSKAITPNHKDTTKLKISHIESNKGNNNSSLIDANINNTNTLSNDYRKSSNYNETNSNVISLLNSSKEGFISINPNKSVFSNNNPLDSNHSKYVKSIIGNFNINNKERERLKGRSKFSLLLPGDYNENGSSAISPENLTSRKGKNNTNSNGSQFSQLQSSNYNNKNNNNNDSSIKNTNNNNTKYYNNNKFNYSTISNKHVLNSLSTERKQNNNTQLKVSVSPDISSPQNNHSNLNNSGNQHFISNITNFKFVNKSNAKDVQNNSINNSNIENNTTYSKNNSTSINNRDRIMISPKDKESKYNNSNNNNTISAYHNSHGSTVIQDLEDLENLKHNSIKFANKTNKDNNTISNTSNYSCYHNNLNKSTNASNLIKHNIPSNILKMNSKSIKSPGITSTMNTSINSKIFNSTISKLGNNNDFNNMLKTSACNTTTNQKAKNQLLAFNYQPTLTENYEPHYTSSNPNTNTNTKFGLNINNNMKNIIKQKTLNNSNIINTGNTGITGNKNMNTINTDSNQTTSNFNNTLKNKNINLTASNDMLYKLSSNKFNSKLNSNIIKSGLISNQTNSKKNNISINNNTNMSSSIANAINPNSIFNKQKDLNKYKTISENNTDNKKNYNSIITNKDNSSANYSYKTSQLNDKVFSSNYNTNISQNKSNKISNNSTVKSNYNFNNSNLMISHNSKNQQSIHELENKIASIKAKIVKTKK